MRREQQKFVRRATPDLCNLGEKHLINYHPFKSLFAICANQTSIFKKAGCSDRNLNVH
jgi:hypothetical protein